MDIALESALAVRAESDVPEEQRPPSPISPHIHQVPEEKADYERTILDYLNEDCWREVLDYLSILEVIQTERVSHLWQRMVVQYLSHVRFSIYRHRASIEHPFFGTKRTHNFLVMLNTAEKVLSFTRWINKLGAAVVSLYWPFEEGMEIIRENCPNLEELRLTESPKTLKPVSSKSEYFNCLRQLCLYYSGDISDECLSQFLAGNALEELKILCNKSITGECLHSLKSSELKSVVLKRCTGLRWGPLFTAADRLGGLTKLVLKRVPGEIGQNVHLLLKKMPRLEHLHIQITGHRCVHEENNVFFEAVCLLSSLEYLYVDLAAGDEHLEAVTCCCEKLRSLFFRCCREVTRRGLEAVGRSAGARLTALGVCGSIRVTDDDVVACVRACPNLTSLVLNGCAELSVYRLRSTLPDRLAAVRRAQHAPSPLNLKLDVGLWGDRNKDVLKIETSEPSNDSDGVLER